MTVGGRVCVGVCVCVREQEVVSAGGCTCVSFHLRLVIATVYRDRILGFICKSFACHLAYNPTPTLFNIFTPVIHLSSVNFREPALLKASISLTGSAHVRLLLSGFSYLLTRALPILAACQGSFRKKTSQSSWSWCCCNLLWLVMKTEEVKCW